MVVPRVGVLLVVNYRGGQFLVAQPVEGDRGSRVLKEGILYSDPLTKIN